MVSAPNWLRAQKLETKPCLYKVTKSFLLERIFYHKMLWVCVPLSGVKNDVESGIMSNLLGAIDETTRKLKKIKDDWK